jgi:hypothetical protein
MQKMLKWTIEIQVDELWVADGFDMDDEIAGDMLADLVPYAHEHELKARVIKAPSRTKIRKIQGY